MIYSYTDPKPLIAQNALDDDEGEELDNEEDEDTDDSEDLDEEDEEEM